MFDGASDWNANPYIEKEKKNSSGYLRLIKLVSFRWIINALFQNFKKSENLDVIIFIFLMIYV